MDFFALMITAATGASLYMTSGAVVGRVLLSKLLSEEKFHLTHQNGEYYVVAGPRRAVLTLAEVPAHEEELRRISKGALLSWPKLLRGLYGSKREKINKISSTLQAKAIASQRNALGVEFLRRDLEDHPAMAYVYAAETDEAFATLRTVIERFDRRTEKELSLTEGQKKILSPQVSENVTVLYPRKSLVEADEQAGGSPAESPQKRGDSRGLPSGYRWNFRLSSSYISERIVISVVRLSTGETVVEDNFSADIWRSSFDRYFRTREIKKKLQKALQAKLNPEVHRRNALRGLR